MGISLPPAVNYLTPLVSMPTVWDRSPVEGSRIVPIEIDWGSYLAAPLNSSCVAINLYGGAAQTISQIVALSVDNSQCSVPVTFVFPDTAQTYQVKDLTPVATFPVFSNQTQFFVNAPGALISDVTRFGVLNSMPFPVSLNESPRPGLPEVAVFNAINVVAGTTAIIPAGISGTITGIVVAFQFAATAVNVGWVLEDGTSKVVAGGQAAAASAAGDNVFITSFSQSGLEIPFTHGLNFVMSVTGAGPGLATVNVYYTVP